MEQDARRGTTAEDYIRKMDRAGIERSLLIAARCGDRRMIGSTEIPYEYIHKACQAYPHRFSGVAGINPHLGIAGLKELDRAVHDYGFVGAHLYPHWFGQAPDAAIYYPYYARCAELGIPIMMQVGHCLVYQSSFRLPSVGRPITLDRIAIDFPELTIIGIHLGYPWTEEMISVCTKHSNVYMAGDAYAPRHWGQNAVHYANTYGQDKFMFGTDWWVIDPERAVREIDELGFRPGSKRKIMRDNAMRVFNLPE
jgi:predicted TIM-barrel fold metal-dependent hydrolase